MKLKKIPVIFVISFFIFTLFKAEANSYLSDITGDLHENAITYLYENNIIDGYPDGTFKPNNEINRAELIKLIATSLNKEISQAQYENCFPDVKEGWYVSYVCFAKAQGWVSGYPDGTFKPEQYINKVETIKIAMEAYNLKENYNITLPFTDTATNEWYAPYLQTAYENGLLEKQSGAYMPAKYIARGEVSEILYRLINGESSYNSQASEISDTTSAINASCKPLTAMVGEIITVKTADELKNAVTTANQTGNTTILLEDGIYTLGNALWISGSNIIIRSASGNRDKVTVKGLGMGGGVSHVFQIEGKNVTIADITLGWVDNHAIQIHGELDADNTLMHNLHILDSYEQLVKISYDNTKVEVGADNGILECSTLEYSAGIGPQWYIGGIDAHNAKDWIVKDNLFKNIISPEEDWAEYAIHFWSNSENTLVENNTIINCDRGIGFGLGDRGHIGGIIRGNKSYHNSDKGDVGIGLENSSNTLIENNIVLQEHDYRYSIEYRFEGTYGTIIKNNTTNMPIGSRDGGTAILQNNTENAEVNWFNDPENGDFDSIK